MTTDYSFCSLCRVNFSEDIGSRRPRREDPTLEAYQQSRKKGCSVCRLVSWVVADYAERCLRPDLDQTRVTATLDREEDSLEVYVSYQFKDSADGEFQIAERLGSLEIFTTDSIKDDTSLVPRGYLCQPERCLSARDAEFSEQALSWLRSCDTTHRCLQSIDQPLPTRVLDVSQARSSGLILLRESAGETGRYVCLSHCWGHVQPLQTIKSNVADHKLAIALEKLPKTFRETVEVTVETGVDYLWIDALCIIQDDMEDWVREAGQMAKVFSNCYLMISATAAADSRCGLFSSAPDGKSFIAERLLPSEITAKSYLNIFYRSRLWHGDTIMDRIASGAREPSYAQQIMQIFPLAQRAWTFQEHLLAPRLLRFTAWELIWECQAGQRCVCRASPAKYETRERYKATTKKGLIRSDPSGFSNWRVMIQTYSRKAITKPVDRLVALSGIAKAIQSATGDEYVAGMWRSTLLEDLVWTLCNRGRDKTDATGGHYIAPSWSWASVNNEISWGPGRLELYRPRIVDASCIPSSGDPTGAVASGSLRISGLVTTCTLRAQRDGDLINYFARQVTDPYTGVVLEHDRPWEIINTESDRFCWLMMGSYRMISSFYSTVMILEHIDDASNDIYRRPGIGIWTGASNDVLLAGAIEKTITII